MKKILSFVLVLTLLTSLLAVVNIPDTYAAVSNSFTVGKMFNIAKQGNNAAHGNHQTRTVHTSHGEYAAYITSSYTDANGYTVDKWSLYKIDAVSGTKTKIFTGEKYDDSSQVSLLVDKYENVWAITSTSDKKRNLTTEGFDCRAYKLDAKTGEVTSYTSIIKGGLQDGYGYATCFYDANFDRIIVMHAGGDYQKGSTRGASFHWTIFDTEKNQWASLVRYTRLEARHCYMFGAVDGKGGLILLAQRDIKAASLGYPEVGSDNGLTGADYTYMQQNGINRRAANYCWDQLDLYYFSDYLLTNYKTYSVCEADYSHVTGTQEERYTLEKRLTNYYPAIQNNNGGDMLLTTDDEGRMLLHITYNKALIQAAMDRSVGLESKWYYQVWDVSDPRTVTRLYDTVITIDGKEANHINFKDGICFRLYANTDSEVFLISSVPGKVSSYFIKESGDGYTFKKVGSTQTLSGGGSLINISSHRGGSITDNKVNILYSSGGYYKFAQATVDYFDYVMGDVNADRLLSPLDAFILKCYLAGNNVSIESQFADFNGNGKVTSEDSLLLRYALANK